MPNGNPWELGLFVVCVDSWSTCACSGRFANTVLGEHGSFRDMGRLLMHLEHCLNISDQPQSFCTLRRFGGSPMFWPAEENRQRIRPGNLATFHIHIRFRRNASWQGTVTWLERHRSMPFRSALELLGLMDSVLTPCASNILLPLPIEG